MIVGQRLIRIAIGGGNPIDQAGLAALLANQPGFEVVSIHAVPHPRVLVWDCGNNLSALPPDSLDQILLILFSGSEVTSFPTGVSGLVTKDETPEALVTAIRQVERGQQYISPAAAISILRHQGRKENSPAMSRIQALSEREREIFTLLAQGLSNKAIAARLYLSVRTVEGHLDKLYSRLGIHSRTEAIVLAAQNLRAGQQF